MKKIIYGISILVLISAPGGCKKFLDVNTDPNNPNDVSEPLILAPLETQVATNIAGGSFSFQNANGIAMVTSFLLQQISVNQPQPNAEGYSIRQDDVDIPWFSIYSETLQNLRILNRKAVANGNHSYGVIAKVLTAYSLGIATDMWGDVPFTEAFDGNFKPAYDSQENIYKILHEILDSAILENQLPAGNKIPTSDDFIYGGDMVKWEKFAYTLKARYYLHLTNAPGYDAGTQASSALEALAKGFAGIEDEASFASYSDNPNSESPWFASTTPDQGGVVLASTVVDSL